MPDTGGPIQVEASSPSSSESAVHGPPKLLPLAHSVLALVLILHLPVVRPCLRAPERQEEREAHRHAL